MNTIRFKIAEMPELRTQVGIARSTKRQEVGGAVCFGVAAGIAIYAGL